MTKKPKLISSIRAKLVSAVAMLLVAVIMVVSSTYAWFTLSTAPEVTGISTQIGANGSLEMALVPADGDLEKITSEAGDGALGNLLEKNLTWGNLVDLSDEGYGLGVINLYPSKLNINSGVIQDTPVQIPLYGADGRVSDLDATKTMTSVYDSTAQKFYAENTISYGVRAIGAASGMTNLQLNYRDARSKAATAASNAKTLASQTLNNNGSALANIAIEYGMGADTASFGSSDVVALRGLITGTQKVMTNIEESYKLYIAAFATSKAAQDKTVAETVANSIYSTATATGDSYKSLSELMTVLQDNDVDLNSLVSGLAARISAFEATKAKVEAADAALQPLETTLASNPDATFTWEQIKGAMTPLADTSKIKVNGFDAGSVKDNLGDLVSSVTSQGGLKVSLATGAGVFADIADHCGDYVADVTIEKVEYNGIVLNNMAAKMETKTSVNPTYLSATSSEAELAGSPAGTSAEKQPFTEFYGYIIDMAFRTNAAESNLLLQTTAVDRIYGDNNNETTMGHGSTMTYTSAELELDKVKALMSCVRVVFFNPNDAEEGLGTVLAYAKLDMSKAKVDDTDNVTAPLVLYTIGEDGGETFRDDAVITALTQNVAIAVSAMVYLDGENLGNDAVAATSGSSLTGKMNLQFASSAALIPMEDGNLHTPNSGSSNAGSSDAGSSDAGSSDAGSSDAGNP